MTTVQPRTLECTPLGAAMEDPSGMLPGPSEPLEDRLLFLQENMVNFVNQYGLPVVEVALVVSKFISIITEKLENTAKE